MADDVHQNQPILKFGADPESAKLGVILLHGRGASAESMLPLARELDVGEVHFLIPQAAQFRWYPNSAFGPIESNEPDLSSALALCDSLTNELREGGLSAERIVFGGFSQGACLSSEYVARNARKYAGLFVLSGALIGPPGTQRDYDGSLEGTPVFIGGSDVDPWIPEGLQRETAQVLEALGAELQYRVYDGMPHTVNDDEIERVRMLLAMALREPRR